MNENNREISLLNPISDAMDWTRQMLFEPFDLSKWFVIAVGAWLATLGDQGVNIPNHFNYNSSSRVQGPDMEGVKNVIMENLPWVIGGAIVLFGLILFLSILLLWLSNRGKFMFLDNVARNEAGISTPWRQFREQGNNLFVFFLILGISAMLFFLLLLGMIGGTIYLMGQLEGFIVALPVILLLFFGLLGLVFGVAVGALTLFTNHFAVAIMYLRGCSVTQAWSELWLLMKAMPGKFILYFLFQIVIKIALGIITGIIALVMCLMCFLVVLLMIPVVNCTVLLPLLTFYRSYSLYYLRQFGPEYDVFANPQVVPFDQIMHEGGDFNES